MSDRRWIRLSLAASAAVITGTGAVPPARAVVVSPRLTLTAPTAVDQDDFCIWVHPTDRSLSTIIASDKAAQRLFVYDLAGTVLQTEPVSGESGNIDVRYGFPLAGDLLDIAVINNRTTGHLQVYRIDPVSRLLTRIDNDDLPSSPDNYGLCLYHSPVTGAFHVFTTTKSGVIRQFELFDSGAGVAATPVRSWSYGSITEGCVADDETGYVYFADEQHGIWKVGAEPGDPAPGAMIASVGDPIGLASDVEGLALYYAADGAGYLFASSQGNSRFCVYDRAPPHAPVLYFTVGGVGSTDGIDVANVDLGPDFPFGVFACHDGTESPTPIEVCGFEDIGLPTDPGYWNPRGESSTAAPPTASATSGGAVRLRAWPNPSRGSTELRFSLPGAARVSLRVVDASGRCVARLLDDRFLDAGPHGCGWDGRDTAGRPVAAGVYFVRLETDAGNAFTRATFLR